MVIGFIDHLQVVTTNNYYTIADLHTTKSLNSKFSQFISNSFYLVTALRNGYSSAMSSLGVSW
jgi:hypothetical protein